MFLTPVVTWGLCPLFQSPATVIGRGSEFELWKAGYYTVVHFSNQDLTVLWDRKTTVHIRAGPQWKGSRSTSRTEIELDNSWFQPHSTSV